MPAIGAYVVTVALVGLYLGRSMFFGVLKGNKGNQQYDIPRGLDPDRYSTVVIWCRAFSSELRQGSASLMPGG